MTELIMPGIALGVVVMLGSIWWILSRCPKCRGKMTSRLRGTPIQGKPLAALDEIWTCEKCGHVHVYHAELT